MSNLLHCAVRWRLIRQPKQALTEAMEERNRKGVPLTCSWDEEDEEDEEEEEEEDEEDEEEEEW